MLSTLCPVGDRPETPVDSEAPFHARLHAAGFLGVPDHTEVTSSQALSYALQRQVARPNIGVPHADCLFTLARRLENPRGIDRVTSLAHRKDGRLEAYLQRPSSQLGLQYYPQVTPPVVAEDSLVHVFKDHVPDSWDLGSGRKKGESLAYIGRVEFEMANTICLLDSLGGSTAPVRFTTRGFLPIAFSGAWAGQLVKATRGLPEARSDLEALVVVAGINDFLNSYATDDMTHVQVAARSIERAIRDYDAMGHAATTYFLLPPTIFSITHPPEPIGESVLTSCVVFLPIVRLRTSESGSCLLLLTWSAGPTKTFTRIRPNFPSIII